MKELYGKFPKWVWLFAGSVLSIFLVGYMLFQAPNSSAKEEIRPLPEKQEVEKVENTKKQTVIVDVKGAVKKPGVYEIAVDGRVKDAIAVSGGFTDEADKNTINLAEKLKDEMVITVFKMGEAEIASHENTSNQKEQKINVNQASISDLQGVPGIGEAKAKAILDYREKEGLFQTIDDLKNVSGIGAKTVEKLKEYLEA
ncbi:helix-hairpin-helix domain-containing protein [Listeria fleischmannii]|uniref:ComEA family DNA-binding protein n=1 Tax=Listeria fleischmannii TaxID=1069827 RepID=A0A841YG43_9LIST|nr:helix-hairpin-helix domain-containing protein [Listeria fleischmannii]EIA20889.1 ComEA family DNA-binding competence protein [Listeria fleischmannii subsp. coloradonensis]MBC1399261.1 ComEA family DNA-binding protein [Listeria fleischmannii]MBC1427587.1 ComEA family DNA-binding protein [Listeria fleischmannii]STY34916.1 ComE operon protein 1 [Listeria fleischmannii subsp. coloradonensis]